MTNWHPCIDDLPGPRYLAIADALARDLAEGRLTPGTRLPTHRELAQRLGVTVGTVSRAYAEAERRGLTFGEVGRGTFVQEQSKSAIGPAVPPRTPGNIDLSIIRPSEDLYAPLLAEAMRDLANRKDLGQLLSYSPYGGLPQHRAAGAEWVRQCGLAAEPQQVIVTSGAQHGLAVTIAALTEPGDLLLTESISYTGITAIATQLHRRRVQGLEMDEYGIRPDALEAACRSGQARALVCVPTLHNPTTVTMSEERRRQIAQIAREHDLKIIDDDVYGFLLPDGPPPLASFAPERSCYVTSLSKALVPGLRVGYVLAPERWVEAIAASVRTSVWMPSPLTAEIASLWIQDGTALYLAERQREEAAIRQAIARRILGPWQPQTRDTAFHLWLHIPEHWRTDVFCQEALNRGVSVIDGDVFVVGRGIQPHAVRICLTAPRSRDELEKGLSVLAELLSTARTPRRAVI
ncbi:MAG TPA: PLP-dependent aminotransferase family protein [Candidatus Competibacteraceae bacterium]|nr:PLP-dependent aminotransferase family protein [Candidatus Competibacteraceae bacterium]